MRARSMSLSHVFSSSESGPQRRNLDDSSTVVLALVERTCVDSVPTMPATEPKLPTLWRTKLRSTLPGVDHSAQERHCRERKLIGIGWRMDWLPPSATLDDACREIEEHDGWGRRPANIVRRFGERAQLGDFVWTRDMSGGYWLCRITGPWRYDGSDAAKLVDVHQVRDAVWAPRALNDLEVPGGVIRRFIGQGESFCQMHDDAARRLTPYLWADLTGEPIALPEITPEEVLTHYLDPYDVEDLIYVWMQVALGYIALPRARQRDTPVYEWSMLHPETERRGVVQVKTGDTPVDVVFLAAAIDPADTDAFAYATSGSYDGDDAGLIRRVDDAELIDFARDHGKLLSPRVRRWFELAGS